MTREEIKQMANTCDNYRSCFKYDTKYYELFDNEEEAKQRLEEVIKN